MSDRTLTEIVARAICDAEWGSGHYDGGHILPSEAQREAYAKQAAAVLSALRDPPPEVVEAGAEAMKHELSDYFSETEWGALDQGVRNWWMHKWLASWRAALDAGEGK